MGRLLAMIVALMMCATAKADVFVIAPPHFAGTDGARVSEEIVRVIQQDLVASQHRVIAPNDAALRVSKEHRVWCRQGPCGERYREAVGAAAAILVRVARAEEGEGPATSFQLGIQPAPGLEYAGGALLSDGPLGDLVVRALREAFRAYRQGPGPWLEVNGAPEGASVFINDVAVGTLPCTAAVPLGSVRVRVEAQTYLPKTDVVSMTSAADRRRLEFRLEPEPALKVRAPAAADHSKGHEGRLEHPTGRAPWRSVLVGGITTAVAGVVLAGVGIEGKLRDGDCDVRAAEAGCTHRSEFAGAGRAMLGSGVSLAVVGAIAAGVGGAKLRRMRVTPLLSASAGRLVLSLGGHL